MAAWLIKRKLASNAARLEQARTELAQVAEQLGQLEDEASDQALRSVVSDDPSASRDAREAAKHAEAMVRHRRHLTEIIDRLERRQDELLDGLSGG